MSECQKKIVVVRVPCMVRQTLVICQGQDSLWQVHNLQLHKYCKGFHITHRNDVISVAFQTWVLVRAHIFTVCPGLEVTLGVCPGLEATLGMCQGLQATLGVCQGLEATLGGCPGLEATLGGCPGFNATLGGCPGLNATLGMCLLWL